MINNGKSPIILWLIGIIFFAGSLVAAFRLTFDDVCRIKLVSADHEVRIARLEEKMMTLKAMQEEMRADIKELLILLRARSQ